MCNQMVAPGRDRRGKSQNLSLKNIFKDVLDKYVNVCYITINVSEMYVPYNILFNRKETLICLRIGIVRT